MKKQLQTFMTTQDDLDFLHEVKTTIPTVAFLDDPPGIQKYAFTINIDSPDLPGSLFIWRSGREGIKPGTRFETPLTGHVAQYLRCIKRENLLLAGRIAFGLDDGHPQYAVGKSFQTTLWKLIRRGRSRKLVCVDPVTRRVLNPSVSNYVVGKGAVDWCVQDRGYFFRDRSVENHYVLDFLVP